ncbi:hypothetical protein JCM19037_2593 [Geomicrobium sp. JCM 19037]|uniref:DUF3311 domain-containing protein n=1 Tax=unclassified Geomicrobium TaxID=2628951 RepID=UPI00045F2BB5|nr:DUF3311 domain-containing protein [Geomicrobium sp. JCM 19037]GAK04208.1 hypothetical protein JCM19037_2593 [Geomicrobium sp. JCM 19037]
MKMPRQRFWLFFVVIVGLAMLQSPLLLLVNRVEPMIFGIPFLIFWIFSWWAFLTIFLFIAYKLNWGYKRTASNE